jgi:hypothetical protein
MIRPPIAVFLIAAALSGCASGPEDADRSSTAAAARAPADVPSGGLPAQVLAPGDCGLFLWSQSAPPEFVFFQRAGEADALALVSGSARTVEPMKVGGDVFGQFLTEGTFRVQGSSELVALSITPGAFIEGGQRISAGRLVKTDADGWETILPVTGVRACMPG